MFLLVNQPTHAKMFQTSFLLKDLKGTWVNFFLVKPSSFGSLSSCNRPFQVLVYPTLVMEWRESCGEFLSRNRALVRTLRGHLDISFSTSMTLRPIGKKKSVGVLQEIHGQPDPLGSVTHFWLQCGSLIWSKNAKLPPRLRSWPFVVQKAIALRCLRCLRCLTQLIMDTGRW